MIIHACNAFDKDGRDSVLPKSGSRKRGVELKGGSRHDRRNRQNRQSRHGCLNESLSGKSRKSPLRREPHSKGKFPYRKVISDDFPRLLHDFPRLSTNFHDFPPLCFGTIWDVQPLSLFCRTSKRRASCSLATPKPSKPPKPS